MCRAPKQHTRSCHCRKGIPTAIPYYGHLWSLMVTTVFTIESTETANPRSGPGLSADLIHLYQTPQPANDTSAAEYRIRGKPPLRLQCSLFHSTLCSSQTHISWCCPSARAGKGQLLLAGSLLTPTYFIRFPGRHFPVLLNLCPVLLAVGSKRIKC